MENSEDNNPTDPTAELTPHPDSMSTVGADQLPLELMTQSILGKLIVAPIHVHENPDIDMQSFCRGAVSTAVSYLNLVYPSTPALFDEGNVIFMVAEVTDYAKSQQENNRLMGFDMEEEVEIGEIELEVGGFFMEKIDSLLNS